MGKKKSISKRPNLGKNLRSSPRKLKDQSSSSPTLFPPSLDTTTGAPPPPGQATIAESPATAAQAAAPKAASHAAHSAAPPAATATAAVSTIGSRLLSSPPIDAITPSHLGTPISSIGNVSKTLYISEDFGRNLLETLGNHVDIVEFASRLFGVDEVSNLLVDLGKTSVGNVSTSIDGIGTSSNANVSHCVTPSKVIIEEIDDDYIEGENLNSSSLEKNVEVDCMVDNVIKDCGSDFHVVDNVGLDIPVDKGTGDDIEIEGQTDEDDSDESEPVDAHPDASAQQKSGSDFDDEKNVDNESESEEISGDELVAELEAARKGKRKIGDSLKTTKSLHDVDISTLPDPTIGDPSTFIRDSLQAARGTFVPLCHRFWSSGAYSDFHRFMVARSFHSEHRIPIHQFRHYDVIDVDSIVAHFGLERLFACEGKVNETLVREFYANIPIDYQSKTCIFSGKLYVRGALIRFSADDLRSWLGLKPNCVDDVDSSEATENTIAQELTNGAGKFVKGKIAASLFTPKYKIWLRFVKKNVDQLVHATSLTRVHALVPYLLGTRQNIDVAGHIWANIMEQVTGSGPRKSTRSHLCHPWIISSYLLEKGVMTRPEDIWTTPETYGYVKAKKLILEKHAPPAASGPPPPPVTSDERIARLEARVTELTEVVKSQDEKIALLMARYTPSEIHKTLKKRKSSADPSGAPKKTQKTRDTSGP